MCIFPTMPKVLFFIWALLLIIHSVCSAEQTELSYEEALTLAAVLADTWSTQSSLLHKYSQLVKPETVVTRHKRSLPEPSANLTGKLKLDKDFLENIWNDDPVVSQNLINTESIYEEFSQYQFKFPNGSSKVVVEDTALVCYEDFKGRTEKGYCKEHSICTSFGGKILGECWRSDVVVACCKPEPGRFFPIPVISEQDVYFKSKRSKRDVTDGGLLSSVAGESADYRAASDAIKAAEAHISLTNKRIRAAKGTQVTAAKYIKKRMASTPSITKSSYAMYELLTAAKVMTKDPQYAYRSLSEILYLVEETETAKQYFEEYCPVAPNCPATRPYRTIDGSCNNLLYPLYGQSERPLVRMLEPQYSDKLWTMMSSYEGVPLPQPRDVSRKVYNDQEGLDKKISTYFMEWGQFLDHDLTHSPIYEGEKGEAMTCCTARGTAALPKEQRHPACIQIEVKSEDEVYGQTEIRCLEMVRTALGFHSDCRLTAAQQVTSVTSYIDASQVYGSTEELAKKLRSFVDGKLASVTINGQSLPAVTDQTCLTKKCGACQYQFGDVRANQQSGLTALQIAGFRHHNLLCDKLKEINPHWPDETLYQEARKILGAIFQHITYAEYLGTMFSEEVLRKHNLLITKGAFSYDYNSHIQGGMLQEFAALAFRMGHTTVMGEHWKVDQIIYGVDKAEEAARKEFLADAFFKCEECCHHDKMQELMYSMYVHPQYVVDSKVEPSMRCDLFKGEGNTVGQDLISLDIHRIYDHGLAPYTTYLKYCGLAIVKDWDDLKKFFTEEDLKNLQAMYPNVHMINPFTAMNLEIHVEGEMMGPTFMCLILEFFARIRMADRFFYTHANQAGSFTLAQLNSIQDMTLTKLLCATIGQEYAVPNAFVLPDETTNHIIKCADLPPINLEPWREDPLKKAGGGVCKAYDGQLGREIPGTCLPPDFCEQGYERYNPMGSTPCEPEYLKCCKGRTGILKAHAGFDKPKLEDVKKFHDSEIAAAAAVKDDTKVQAILNRLDDLARAAESKPDAERLVIDGVALTATTKEQSAIAINAIKEEFTLKFAIQSLAPGDPAKQLKLAVQLYGIHWKEWRTLVFCTEPTPCDFYIKYATLDGSCNNLRFPNMGVAMTSLPITNSLSSFPDEISSFTGSVFDADISPRTVARAVFERYSEDSSVYTLLLPYFEKLVIMDIFQGVTFNGMSYLDCCNLDGTFVDPQPFGCAAIKVDPYDQPFSSFRTSCIPVLLNPPGESQQCSIRPSTPANAVTGVLDLSFLYGVDPHHAEEIREMYGGLLKMQIIVGDRFPVLIDDEYLVKKFPKACEYGLFPCKLIGTPAVNREPALLPLVTILAREHNRLARILGRIYHYWTDSEIFFEARAILIAQWQAIIFNEFIPAILGDYWAQVYKLTLEDVPYNVQLVSRHDSVGPSDNTGVLVMELLYLTMVKPVLDTPYQGQYRRGYESLEDNIIFHLSGNLYSESKTVDLAIQTMLEEKSGIIDNHLFQQSEGVFVVRDGYNAGQLGFDYASVLIQKGRLNGLPSYVEMVKACTNYQLPLVRMADLQYWITDEGIYRLRSLYGDDAKKVELLAALTLEKPLAQGSRVGAVTACILAKLFRDWAVKDRFFFNNPYNPRKFSADQIGALATRTLAGLLCDNTEFIDAYHPGYFSLFPANVFIAENDNNRVQRCSDFSPMDLSEWVSIPEPQQTYKQKPVANTRTAQRVQTEEANEAREDVADALLNSVTPSDLQTTQGSTKLGDIWAK